MRTFWKTQWAVSPIIPGLVLALLGSVAAGAGGPATYDKGELGTYVRDGRFMHRTDLGSSTASTGAHAMNSDRAARFDKGDLGSYVRVGQFLWHEKGAGAESSAASTATTRQPQLRLVDHQKHVHRFPM